MQNNDWEKNLRDLLGDYKPEGLQPNWDEFANQMDQMAEINQIGEDPVFDEHLKESIETFSAPGSDAGWQLIKASLDAADRQFDEDIRRRIAQFEPKYDPRTWPLFLQRLADSNFLRAKLIAVKVVEIAAVFLLLFTFVHMGRIGKLPFDTPLYNKSNDVNSGVLHNGMADLSSGKKDSPHPIVAENDSKVMSSADAGLPSSSDEIDSNGSAGSVKKASASTLFASAESYNSSSKTTIVKNSSRPKDMVSYVDPLASIAVATDAKRNSNPIPVIKEGSNLNDIRQADQVAGDEMLATNTTGRSVGKINFLASITSPLVHAAFNIFPHPTYVKQRKGTHTVFGILTQVDYNRLRMPEDRLHSAGRTIVFPQQGLPSYGYGGGFTFALDHPRWAVETGLIYNTKTFEPGRKLAVGTAFDNGVVEFDAMRLQLLTMPFQLRYKVENKGAFKFYAMAGLNLNLIVQSDVDVSIKYHFPSLSINETPSSNPVIANTIKESRRVSEHIRDGAPFSAKSFVSGAAGLGIEYSFNEHKTFFFQSALQYQIPNLKFSNNNGKHVRSISIQTGVRTPLGN